MWTKSKAGSKFNWKAIVKSAIMDCNQKGKKKVQLGCGKPRKTSQVEGKRIEPVEKEKKWWRNLSSCGSDRDHQKFWRGKQEGLKIQHWLYRRNRYIAHHQREKTAWRDGVSVARGGWLASVVVSWESCFDRKLLIGCQHLCGTERLKMNRSWKNISGMVWLVKWREDTDKAEIWKKGIEGKYGIAVCCRCMDGTDMAWEQDPRGWEWSLWCYGMCDVNVFVKKIVFGWMGQYKKLKNGGKNRKRCTIDMDGCWKWVINVHH